MHSRRCGLSAGNSIKWGIVRSLEVKKRPTPAKVGRSYSYYEARREGCRRCNKAFG
jgi:hypothetical protein